MANGHPQYTVRQSSGYVFRLRLPRQSGKGELRFSLKTHDRLLAARRAADVAFRIKEDLARMPELTRYQIKELISEYIRDSLESIRDYTIHRRSVDPDEHDNSIEGLDLHYSELLENLALNRLKTVKVDVDRILQKHDLTASDELHRELSHAILSAQVDMTATALEALKTGRAPTTEGIHVVEDRGRIGAPNKSKEEPSALLIEVLGQWWQKTSKSWSRRTLVDYTHIRSVVEDAFGGRPIAEIKSPHVEAFGKKLTSEGKAPKTVNKYLGFLSSVFGYAEKLDLIPKNPASGLSVPEAKHAKEKREAFTDDDIKAIFGSEWRAYRERDAAKYWVPLLALYTGCRLEELCQLYTDDVQQVEGVWSLLIRAERHDQSVKTGENRTVPLHDAILKRGFIGYAQAQEEGRVFPGLKRVNHRYGHGLGQWFARHKKNMGVNSAKKVFHSFRHTVPTRLKDAGVEDSLVAELLGHRMAGQTFGRYAKASSPRVLLDRAVSKLDFKIG